MFYEKNYYAFLLWFSVIVNIIHNQLNIKKKSIKIILEKIIWENTATIHSALKKKNYKAKLSISSILKQNRQKQF